MTNFKADSIKLLQILLMIILILVILILIGAQEASAVTICASVTEIPAAECAALEELFTTTDGANSWTEKGDWLLTNTPCSWYGVLCDNSVPRHVKQLNLSSNGLTGTLPNSLGNLTSMTGLYMDNNALSGGIPATFSALTNLSVLNLATNTMNGAIPPGIGSLSQLTQLNLDYNAFSGPIPTDLGLLTKLTHLTLVGNDLDMTIPIELGELALLEVLDLGDNRLSGAIPAELGKLQNLNTLFVEKNMLGGIVPVELCSLTNLFFLTLEYNALDPVATDPCISLIIGENWKDSQTVPPQNLVGNSYQVGEVSLQWSPVSLTPGVGHFEIFYRPDGVPPYNAPFDADAAAAYTYAGETADKTTTAFTISGLDETQKYFFIVRTVTDDPNTNKNVVVSADSLESAVIPTALTLVDFSAGETAVWYAPLAIIGLLVLLTLGGILLQRRAVVRG